MVYINAGIAQTDFPIGESKGSHFYAMTPVLKSTFMSSVSGQREIVALNLGRMF